MNPNNNGHHQHEAWHYQDGNATMQYQRSTWSTPHPSLPSPPSGPSMPSQTQFPTSTPSAMHPYGINNTHQQMHAAAMAHHQSAMQHHQQVQQNMFSNMAHMSSARQYPDPPQARTDQAWVMSTSVGAQESSDEETEESDSDSDESADMNEHISAMTPQQTAQLEQQQQVTLTRAIEEKLAADRRQNAEDRRALEQRYVSDQRDIQRQGASLDARLRKLEEMETTNRTERNARDDQMQKLREENAWLIQQQNLNADKHRQELAGLPRTPINQPQQAATLFESRALNQPISEIGVVSPFSPIREGKQKAAVDLSTLTVSEHAGTGQESHALGRSKKPSKISQRARQALPGAQVLDLQRISSADTSSVPAKGRSRLGEKPSGMLVGASESQQTGNTLSRTLEESKAQSLSSNFERALATLPKSASASRHVTESVSSRKPKNSEHAIVKLPNPELKSSAVTDPALLRRSKHRDRGQSSTAVTIAGKSARDETAGANSALVRTDRTSKYIEPSSDSLGTLSNIAGPMPRAPVNRHRSPPEDFPDNASQISSWERGRAGRRRHRSVAGNTVPDVQTATNTAAGQDIVLSSRPKKSDKKQR